MSKISRWKQPINTKAAIRIALLSLIVGGIWGGVSVRDSRFPYPSLLELRDYFKGLMESKGLLLERLMDHAISRRIRFYETELTDDHKPVFIDGLRDRRAQPRLLLRGPQPDYRVLIGGMDFEDSFWGAVLLDADGEVLHQWKLTVQPPSLSDMEHHPYGACVLPDGSIVATWEVSRKTDEGEKLTRVSPDGALVWASDHGKHHSVVLDETGETLWTIGRPLFAPFPTLNRVDVKTGDLIRSIKLETVASANPDTHILDLRSSVHDTEHLDPAHANDIEILTSDIAEAFPMFSAGDLLINYRHTNLQFVLDPNTLEIKWWHLGAVDGGHDADFQPDGSITVFNNQWRSFWKGPDAQTASTIVAIDPAAKTHRELISGEARNLKTRYNGSHQIRQGRYVMFDSSCQGRFTEIDIKTGTVVFEFINLLDPEKGTSLHTLRSVSFPRSFFNASFLERLDAKKRSLRSGQ